MPKDKPIIKNHFAFGVDLKDLLQAENWLNERGIMPRGDYGKEPLEPYVLAWMPAASIYFNDPDGNSLELIALLKEVSHIF